MSTSIHRFYGQDLLILQLDRAREYDTLVPLIIFGRDRSRPVPAGIPAGKFRGQRRPIIRSPQKRETGLPPTVCIMDKHPRKKCIFDPQN